MAFINVKRNKLFFRVDGDPGAPPLVLANSLGTDHRMWDAQMEALTQHFRVLRYDMRGHGQSDAPDGPYTIADLAEDALGLMDEVHIGRGHVCGLSLGGIIAQWIALNAPDRVDRLILANTAPYIGPPEAWDERIATVERDGMKPVAEAVVKRWFTDGFRRRNPQTVQAVKQLLLAANPAGYAACCAAIRDADFRGQIANVGTPTLVIAGRDDPVTTLDDAKLLVDSIHGAWGKVLAAAHLSNIEDTPHFNDAVLKFLMA